MARTIVYRPPPEYITRCGTSTAGPMLKIVNRPVTTGSPKGSKAIGSVEVFGTRAMRRVEPVVTDVFKGAKGQQAQQGGNDRGYMYWWRWDRLLRPAEIRTIQAAFLKTCPRHR